MESICLSAYVFQNDFAERNETATTRQQYFGSQSLSRERLEKLKITADALSYLVS